MPVYALDWLGMGRSARVSFVVKANRHVHEADSFFVDSLEEWRVKMGLETMALVWHSLGRISAWYTRFATPSCVGNLVLISPAGMLGDQDSTTSPAREPTDDQKESKPHSNSTVRGQHGAKPSSNSERVKSVREEQKQEKEKDSRKRKVFTYLWETSKSPLALVRRLGVFRPMLIGNYASRYRDLSVLSEEARNVSDYFLSITPVTGSGEYCISHLLAPFAVARMPLVDRIHEVKVPVVFLYGEHDWTDPQGGVQSTKKLQEAGNNNARIYVVDKAGHHEVVNDTLMNELYTDFIVRVN